MEKFEDFQWEKLGKDVHELCHELASEILYLQKKPSEKKQLFTQALDRSHELRVLLKVPADYKGTLREVDPIERFFNWLLEKEMS